MSRSVPHPSRSSREGWGTRLAHRVTIVAVLIGLGLSVCPPPAAAAGRDGWIPLSNGKDLTGWQNVTDGQPTPSNWVIEDGVMHNVPDKATDGVNRNLRTTGTWKNFQLHVEFNCGHNSGVYLRGHYEIQVSGSHGSPPSKGGCGAIYGKYAPRVNASRPDGEWQSFDIAMVGNTISVVHNGILIHDRAEVDGKTGGALGGKHGDAGPIFLQGDHGEIRYRNLRIRPLPADARIEDVKLPVGGTKYARVLMVTQSAGFRHGAVNRKNEALAPAEKALTQLGISSGLFRVECTQDVAKDFTRAKLDETDIVFFYTTGDLPIAEDVRDYFFKEWLTKKGHGFIGAHSAADTYHNYKPYWDMIGGTFNGHPWGAGETVTVTVHDGNHPVSRPWGGEFVIKDEIYRFKNWQPEKVRVLMSLNMAKTAKKEPYHVPIAWVKNYGQGKVLHMSLGHREDVWTNPTYLESLLGGIKWIMGLEQGDATPNPELSAAQETKARADVKAAK